MNRRVISEKADNLIEYCAQAGRVCPNPDAWVHLWRMLPNKERVGNSWKPSLPLILDAWYDSPSAMKILRLNEHIEWADANRAIDIVDSYIRGLDELNWHHFGD